MKSLTICNHRATKREEKEAREEVSNETLIEQVLTDGEFEIKGYAITKQSIISEAVGDCDNVEKLLELVIDCKEKEAFELAKKMFEEQFNIQRNDVEFEIEQNGEAA